MGLILESHGRIAVEERRESFIVHPTYGYERTCPVCEGDPPSPLMGECAGGCTVAFRERRVDEPGRVPDFADEPFGEHWRERAHPEFLLEDLDDLIAALTELRERRD